MPLPLQMFERERMPSSVQRERMPLPLHMFERERMPSSVECERIHLRVGQGGGAILATVAVGYRLPPKLDFIFSDRD